MKNEFKLNVAVVAGVAVVGLVALIALSVMALPGGEARITADGGLRIAPWKAAGPDLIEVSADGNATIYFLDTYFVSGSDSLRVNQLFPGDALGDSMYYLRDGLPRPFYCAGDKVDSLYIDVDTATEVIVTW